MKINWGTGIVMAFAIFISFILYFVIRMGTDARANHDLVTEEYYKAELGYQKQIDAAHNSSRLIAQTSVKKTAMGLEVRFPENLDPQKISGTVTFYRPSNKHMDFTVPIQVYSSILPIPDKRLLEGRWDITIAMEYEGEHYLYKQSLTPVK